jgi:hypothetical protein
MLFRYYSYKSVATAAAYRGGVTLRRFYSNCRILSALLPDGVRETLLLVNMIHKTPCMYIYIYIHCFPADKRDENAMAKGTKSRKVTYMHAEMRSRNVRDLGQVAVCLLRQRQVLSSTPAGPTD